MAGSPGKPRKDRQGIRCNGTTNTGEPCGKYASPGKLQCQYHREDRKNCPGTNRDGTPCTRTPMDGRDVCWSHDPARVAATEAVAKRCIASHKDGTPCGARALKGLDVCRRHGGGTPRSRRAAARRIEEEKARKEFARIGEVPPVTNALLTLQRRAGRIEAFCDLLEQHITDIKVADWRYASQQDLEQINGLVQLFVAQQDRCVSSLTGLARVQVDERLVAIEEKKADMLMGALDAAIAALFKVLGIAANTEAQQAAYQAFSRKLTIIKGELDAG